MRNRVFLNRVKFSYTDGIKNQVFAHLAQLSQWFEAALWNCDGILILDFIKIT